MNKNGSQPMTGAGAGWPGRNQTGPTDCPGATWIGAYYDDELHAGQRKKVEEHLRTCPACQAELAALQELSVQLQTTPEPARQIAPERFISQVRLRISPAPETPPAVRFMRLGWRLAPLAILGLWSFGQAVLGVSMALLTLLPFFGTQPQWLTQFQPGSGWLGDLQVVPFLVIEFGLTALAAALLWGWLASWWAAHQQTKA